MHHRIPLKIRPQAITGCALLLALLLIAAPSVVISESETAYPSPVGEVELDVVAGPLPEQVLLDVGLVVLDAGIPADPSSHSEQGIFPRIRQVEAQYLPVLLRQVLQQTGAWGVVRVMPEATILPEVLLTGSILYSDGRRLVLQVNVRDATGRSWLDRVYVDESTDSDFPVAVDSDPFIDLYGKMANDLADFRDTLSPAALNEIRRVAFLRYAASLSPDAFGGYLAGPEEGPFRVVRLPAEGDPMIERVERIRNQEFLFIDNLDEQYLALVQDMATTYNQWRQYNREQALYLEDYQQRVSRRDSAGARGSFSAMQQGYAAYRLAKIQQQDVRELAQGFNNEVAPTVVEVSGRVFRLSGTLQTQYADWRRILREIFTLETGLPAVVED